MSSDNNFSLPPAVKLKGTENYPQWKSQIQVLLESKDLESYILPTNIKPDPAEVTSDEVKTWKVNNAKAKMAIMLNVVAEPAELISSIEAASEMWSTLQSQYEGQGHNLKHLYFN